MIVGGAENQRGVVHTASYEAQAFLGAAYLRLGRDIVYATSNCIFFKSVNGIRSFIFRISIPTT